MSRRTQCPEPEVLAGFVEGSLGPAERSDVVAHLAGCEACRDVVRSATAVVGELEGGPSAGEVVRPRVPLWRRAALPGLAAAAMAVFAITLLYRTGEPPGPINTPELWSAAGDLPADAVLDAYSLWPTLRGGSGDREHRRDSLRLGALLADLEAGWNARRDVTDLLVRFRLTLAAIPLSQPTATVYEQFAGTPGPPAIAERISAEALLWPVVDADWFDLGRRAEVTRLLGGAGLDAEWRESLRRALRSVAGDLEGSEAAAIGRLADSVATAPDAAALAEAATEALELLAD